MAQSDDWRGFEPTGYEINWKLLSEASLSEIGEGKNRIKTTAGAVLREVLPHLCTLVKEDSSLADTPARQTCEVEEGIGRMSIKTPTRTIQLDTLGNGSSFAADLVATVIKIDQIPPHGGFHPIFFYYDTDHVVDDVHDCFSFLVVNADRIVLERVTLSRHSRSGFDPAVFKPFYKVDRPTWRSDRYVEIAKARWWYRKFYEETDAGRLTTLREDVDIYHYVPEWKQRQITAASMAQIATKIAQVQRLLVFVLIALGLIVLWLWI